MALHERRHPEPVAGCFGCKIIGLSYGTVPGAYRDSSRSAPDRDMIEQQLSDKDGNPLFNRERVEDARSDFARKAREVMEA